MGRASDTMTTMTQAYAQTNLQLYTQLRECGYSPDQLATVRAGYDLVMRLCTAAFRGSGKPLIAHLVGTASILASIEQPVTIVTAGLLHAAYALGDFGDGRLGMTEGKRQRVREAVGHEIEDFVSRYTAFDWNRNTIPGILQRVTALSPIERDVLVIRLANELEDHLDYGVLYCGNGEERRDYIRSPLNQSVDMARKLGLDTLASALDRAFRETLAAELPASLRNLGHDYTFMQPPASHSPRLKVAARRYLDERPALAKIVHPLAVLTGQRS
jgi:(p)ppGpp synthase/HD superfamily hydrolase